MAISGSYAAGDEVFFSNAETWVDLGSTGTFVEITSWSTDVQVNIGGRDTSTVRTHGGSSIVGVSQRNDDEITMTVVYSEDATDPFENIWEVYENGTSSSKVDVRFQKDAATTGDKQFTTSGGKLISCSMPQPLDASDGTVATFTFTVRGQLGSADIA